MQRAKHDVGGVAGKIPDDAASKRAPGAPARGHVSGAVRTALGRSQPQVPVQSFRNRRGFGRALHRTVSAIKPDVGLTDFANDTSPHKFDGSAQSTLCGTLVSHLRDNFVARGGFPHDPRFMDRPRQRLFTVDVFAKLIAATAATACVWSGVATRTASICFSIGSNI